MATIRSRPSSASGAISAGAQPSSGAVDGVDDCTVDLPAKTATMTLAHDVPDETLMEAVKAKRFTPVKML